MLEEVVIPKRSFWLGLALYTVSMPTASAQDPPQVRTFPSAVAVEPPIIDGVIEDAEWLGATTIGGALRLAVDDQLTENSGIVWILYDAANIYVASRVFLRNPQAIKADESRDNASLLGNDRFTIEIDPMGTTRDVSTFSFNPRGANLAIIAGGRAGKREWSGRLVVRARTTSEGWEGEAVIPWRVMNLPPPGVHDLRFYVQWHVSSIQQDVTFRSLNADYRNMDALENVTIPAISDLRSVRVLPYAYLGYTDSGTIIDAGLDLKSRLGDPLTLVATVNPDFRNVENSILNLDFSNYERLAGETRPYFMEGAAFMPPVSLFASQRVQALDAGVKLYGHPTKNARLGTLAILDYHEQALALANFGMNIDTSTFLSAAVVTHDTSDRENTSAGIDVYRAMGKFIFSGYYQGSFDSEFGSGESWAAVGEFLDDGASVRLAHRQVSPDFHPSMGFNPIQDLKSSGISAGLIRAYPGSDIAEVDARMSYFDAVFYDGRHRDELFTQSVSIMLRSGTLVSLSALQDRFLERRDFQYTLSVQVPRFDQYRSWTLAYSQGNLVETPYRSLTLSARYRPVRPFQLQLSHQMVDHETSGHQTILSLNFELGSYQSMGGRIVGSNGDWNWFLSYRLSGNLGTEYFLILGNPNSAVFENSLVFKFATPLSIRG